MSYEILATISTALAARLGERLRPEQWIDFSVIRNSFANKHNKVDSMSTDYLGPEDIEAFLKDLANAEVKLGMKNSNNISVPFKIAFNSLLNKNLINHY